MFDIFLYRQRIIQREGRDGKIQSARITNGQQSAHVSILTHQQQSGARVFKIAVFKGIISTQHLIARIEGIQTILTCTHAERVLYGAECRKIRIEQGKIKPEKGN